MGTGTRVGVYGKAELANTAFGVYGAADSTSAIITRAGYFSGSLEYTGSLIGPSDEKLKENIRSFSGALDMLGTLEVKTYSFKPEYAFMHFSKGKQIGIMADNLVHSFPELVSSSVHPAEYDPETGKEISREVSYKGVNYLGLVPVLVQGIKEQQEQINMLKKSNEELDNLKKENELLKNRLDALEARISSPNRKETGQNGSSRPYLEQNVPNPFSDKSIIRYFIPEGSGRCSIAIYTADHSLVKSIAVEGYGYGQAEVQAGTLKSGNYSCELLINQVVVDSKQMIIIR